MKKMKAVVACLVAGAILCGGGAVKAQQGRQAELRNAELECAKGNYHWDLPYTDFSLAEEAVQAVMQKPDMQSREADIRVSKYNSIRIGEELENGNQISPGLNFQLNVLFPNKYFMNQERSVVVHVHYPAEVKAGESAVISVHLKDSDGVTYEGEWEFTATDDLRLTPGFMSYDGVFWESHSFDTQHWAQVTHIDWAGEVETDGKYSDMAVFRFYASTDKIDTEKGYESGCLHGGCSTIIHSFYGH